MIYNNFFYKKTDGNNEQISKQPHHTSMMTNDNISSNSLYHTSMINLFDVFFSLFKPFKPLQILRVQPFQRTDILVWCKDIGKHLLNHTSVLVRNRVGSISSHHTSILVYDKAGNGLSHHTSMILGGTGNPNKLSNFSSFFHHTSTLVCSSNLRKTLSKKAGFTLMELLVVIVIIGTLAAFVAPKFFDQPAKARQVAAKQQLESIVAALEMYNLDNRNYPSSEQGLKALVKEPSGSPEAPNWKKGGYMKSIPKDPWEREYIYLSPGVHDEESFDLISYGADGKKGGEGEDSDVFSWNEDK